MSDSAGPLHLERDGDVAVVVLDNPPLNLFDELVFDELERIAGELADLTAPGRDDRARAVLFEARGRHVSPASTSACSRSSPRDRSPSRGGRRSGRGCCGRCRPSRTCRCRRCSPRTA